MPPLLPCVGQRPRQETWTRCPASVLYFCDCPPSFSVPKPKVQKSPRGSDPFGAWEASSPLAGWGWLGSALLGRRSQKIPVWEPAEGKAGAGCGKALAGTGCHLLACRAARKTPTSWGKKKTKKQKKEKQIATFSAADGTGSGNQSSSPEPRSRQEEAARGAAGLPPRSEENRGLLLLA